MELNLRDTELRLGLPGSDMKKDQKRILGASMSRSLASQEESTIITNNQEDDDESCPPAKVQVVGWPPIRSYRKNVSVSRNSKVEEKKGNNNNNNKDHQEYVKVSMDGAPYLRKIHLKLYNTYPQLLNALQIMFNCTFGQYSEREGYDGSEFVPTYEDKDGDWMLVGDVPWNMFMLSCKRLRIMKGSEAKGLGCL